MDPKIASVALVGAVAGAAVVALFAVGRPAPPEAPPAAEPAGNRPALPADHPPLGTAAMPPGHPPMGSAALPPGHPPTGAGLPPGHPPAGGGVAPPGPAEAPALRWASPPGWQTLPNPNAMRLATYRPPAAPGDADAAELTVSRAGGTPEANIQRWLGQFDDAGPETRDQKTVRGLAVIVIEVKGTFLGGGPMMGGAPSAPRPGWMLRAAIVQTPGFAYFFKLTGPAATVAAARPAFDAMIDALEPVP